MDVRCAHCCCYSCIIPVRGLAPLWNMSGLYTSLCMMSWKFVEQREVMVTTNDAVCEASWYFTKAKRSECTSRMNRATVLDG
jgi:hypothetical protein